MTAWDDLAQYNTERSRGIQHTPERDAEMARQQAAFDEWIQLPVEVRYPPRGQDGRAVIVAVLLAFLIVLVLAAAWVATT